MRKSGLSKIAVALVILFVIAVDNNLGLWKDDGRVIVNDVYAYYAYLPSVFIHKDITLDYLNYSHVGDQFVIWPKLTPDGKKVITASIGMSYMYFPFFINANWIARTFGYPATGYSLPYRFALLLSNVVFLFIGLLYLRKLLVKYFSDLVTAIVILVVPLTTNMLWYIVVESPMTHVYSFALISVFLYHSDKWHERISLKRTVYLGLLLGLVALIRPTNILILLIFVLWDVKSFKELWQRIILYLNNWKLVLIMIVAFILVWVPQFVYWKMQTGHFFYYSYPDDQGFFFNNPQIFNNLFSWRKGWLLYTPVMAFALIGIFFLWKNFRKFFIPILVFTVFVIYVISSWWDWWYGGGFGIRAYIDLYGVFAIPIAAFLSWGFSLKRYARVVVLAVFLLVAVRSSFHHMQYHYGAVHWDSMTREAFFDSFWRMGASNEFPDLIRNPDYQLARKGIYKYADESDEK